MDPQVSIGLTFYNDASTLVDALRSVFAQTYQDWELILADDTSSDGSLEIARSIDDPRVRVVSDGMYGGFVYRLNQMTKLAKGKYYARMDADDLMHPQRLEKQIAYLEANQSIDLVDTAMYSMDRQCRATGIRGLKAIDLQPIKILKRSLLSHATVLGQTEWFRKNLYNPKYIRAEDYELWCRTFQTSRFSRIEEPLYFVREGRVNIHNYLLSCRTVRLCIREYGPRLVGQSNTLRLLVLFYMKSFIYMLFNMLNAHEVLVGMRNDKLSKDQKDLANNIIKHIQATPVPGLCG